MTRDPFAELGLTPDATDAEIREARRRLAKQHHPDLGGDDERMRSVNAAAAAALRAGASATVSPEPRVDESHDDAPAGHEPDSTGVTRDVPSFTVEALPVETFEALAVVGAELGEVVDEDPPYRLEVVVGDPLRCWCRLDVVPDAGASTVSLTVGAVDRLDPPATDVVRDSWITALNALDWPDPP